MVGGVLDQYTIEELAERCEQRQRQGHVQDESRAHEAYCMEIFRRAVTSNDRVVINACWEEIRRLYRKLVAGWIRRRLHRLGEDEALDMADDVFERFWRHFKRKQFDNSIYFGAIMDYLRSCATSVAIDWKRDEQRQRYILETDLAKDSAQDITQDASALDTGWFNVASQAHRSPDDEAEQREMQRMIWGIIRADIAKNDRELVMAELTWSEGLKPREILALRPDLFKDVQQVYEIGRVLRDRASASERLHELHSLF